MAQRFPGAVPSQVPAGPPQQRYAPPQQPGMRQYPGQSYPVGWNFVLLLLFIFILYFLN